jgi:hypothetical protein
MNSDGSTTFVMPTATGLSVRTTFAKGHGDSAKAFKVKLMRIHAYFFI